MSVDQWVKRGLIYAPPDGSDWRQTHAQLPVVDDAHPDYWRIYYSSRDRSGQSMPAWFDVEAGRPEHLLRENIGPLFLPGEGEAFDRHGIMPTAVVTEGNRTLLYYIGWSRQTDVPYRNAIGLAVSQSGSAFERWSDQPLIGVNAVDPVYTGTLNVLREGDDWHGYYMSCTGWHEREGRLEPRYHLRYAHSKDGFDWHRDGRVVIDFASPGEGGVVAASTLKLAPGDYRMWYCYRGAGDFRHDPSESYRIGMARSSDAVHWRRCDEQVGIERSADGWDSLMQCYPNVVRYGNRLYLFYNGNGFGQSGIGYATMEIKGE